MFKDFCIAMSTWVVLVADLLFDTISQKKKRNRCKRLESGRAQLYQGHFLPRVLIDINVMRSGLRT